MATVLKEFNISTMGSLINNTTEKKSLVDFDMFPVMDSQDKNLVKKYSWKNFLVATENQIISQLNGYYSKSEVDTLISNVPNPQKTVLAGNDATNRRYVRLASFNDSSTDAEIQFIYAGAGDFGTPQRSMYIIHMVHRNDNMTFRAYSYNHENVTDIPTFYTRKIATNLYECWVLEANYNRNKTATLLNAFKAEINVDSVTSTAPSDLVAQTVSKVWHESNGGSGSGLDADMLDGQHATNFVTQDDFIKGRYYPTSNTVGTYANQWTKIATITLTYRYAESYFNAIIVNSQDGTDHTEGVSMRVRVYQSAVMGSPPNARMVLYDSDTSQLSSANVAGVIVQNDATATKVEIWIKIVSSWRQYRIFPQYSGNDIVFHSESGFQASLPAGTQITKQEQLYSLLSQVYPVGAIYMSTVATSPATLFGFGTWVAIAGRFLIGADGTYGAGTTGGDATHTHTITHTHNQGTLEARLTPTTGGFAYEQSTVSYTANRFLSISGASDGSSSSSRTTGVNVTGNTGASSSANTGSGSSLPPYLSVYMWQRTA